MLEDSLVVRIEGSIVGRIEGSIVGRIEGSIVGRIEGRDGEALVVDVQALHELVKARALIDLITRGLAKSAIIDGTVAIAAQILTTVFFSKADCDVARAVHRDACGVLEREEIHVVEVSLVIEVVDSNVCIIAHVFDVLG